MIASAAVLTGCAVPAELPDTARELAAGWWLRAAADCEDGGEEVSSTGYDTAGWIGTEVPSTVMAALVANGHYPDLYVGTNLEKVPKEQFQAPWWYRTEFELPAEEAASTARLKLEGINYSAEVWLNGEQVATREEVTGAYLIHQIDVSGTVRAGSNALAVQVFPPDPGDFTIGFVDWNPRPPDENMGIFRPVILRLTGGVSLEDVFVQSDVDLDTLDEAELRVSAMVRNHGDREVRTSVNGEIEDIRFSADVVLAPRERQLVEFTPESYDALRVASPRLWWPHNLGDPNLYLLRLTVEVEGEVSDTIDTTFGVREFATYLNDEGHRGFTVNGKPVLIRGGGWVDDLLLADTVDKLEAQLAYVKQMNLNTIRLEGFWGTSHALYDIADRLGILVMPGWSCHWEWEHYVRRPVDETYGGVISPADQQLVASSLRDQILWLRNHPSVFTWVLASDLLPHPELERRYQKVLAEVDTTRPPLTSCGWLTSEVSGPTAVKMRGPYDWVPPPYWYEDRERGGAYGFNTETGPGPQPPPLESLKRMIPEEHLWPIDEVWAYHCARNEFNTPARFATALDRRYGPSASVEEFLAKAQVASYEAIRPMFEGFGVNRPLSTGVIQWMLNSAWPAMFWQLYDHYLMPSGAFYGTRAACQPYNLAFNYHDRAVYAVNDTLVGHEAAVATVRAFDLGAKEIQSETVTLDLKPNASQRLVSLADIDSPTPVWFLDLRLADASGTELGRNFYWLSTTQDVLDYEASEWFITPTKEYADFTALGELPEVVLDVEVELESDDNGTQIEIELENPSDALAFFVELQVVDDEDRSFLPVLWEDNYVSLLPGEKRELVARFPQTNDLSGAALKLAGWNVPETVVAVSPE
jgi:exo-1,4-beta-D-glucosaminidase